MAPLIDEEALVHVDPKGKTLSEEKRKPSVSMTFMSKVPIITQDDVQWGFSLEPPSQRCPFLLRPSDRNGKTDTISEKEVLVDLLRVCGHCGSCGCPWPPHRLQKEPHGKVTAKVIKQV